ncbi:MAG TPA: hypothetical protein VM120_06940 [Bryobacteraceae bacterium]|nr:hypothetical protein [Bryobacteraceae bacterium]
MKKALLLFLVLFVSGCNSTGNEAGLAEVINVADGNFGPQLLRGFYEVEEGSWRWTQPKFAVALKPPRKAGSNGAILFLRYSIPDAVMAKLKETSISISVDGIPLAPEKVSKPGLAEIRREVPADALKGKTGVTAEFSVDPVLPMSDVDKRLLGVIVHTAGLVKK